MAATIRPAVPEDIAAILEVCARSGAFSGEEIDVLGAQLEARLPATASTTRIIVAGDATGTVRGFAFYEWDEITRSTWELWWIAVDPAAGRSGVGRALMEHMAADARSVGATLMIIPTSSKAGDGPRRFYQTCGYREVARIDDYYAPGDAMVTYAMRL